MRNLRELLRDEPRLRPFLIAHAQSSLGNGAAYVALLVLVYDRFDSALAVSVILLAEFLPAMVAGPLLGAAADRWGRRNCALVSDLLRAVAFAGLAFAHPLGLMFALALLSGVGASLFTPAANALLPTLVERRHLPAANAVFGALIDGGLAVGPLLAAPILLVAGARAVLLVNAVTFVLSALLIARLPRDVPAGSQDEERESLLAEARAGLRMAARLPVVRIVLGAAAVGVLFGAAVNVGEVALAIDYLDVGGGGYALLVAVNSAATVIGALAASGAPVGDRALARRFVLGLALEGVGLAAAGGAAFFSVAIGAFAAAGLGNGFGSVNERTLLQSRVPEEAHGRVFGVRDALNSWGFGLAFLGGGVVVQRFGAAAVFVGAGAGLIAVAATAFLPLSRIDPSAGGTGEPVAGV